MSGSRRWAARAAGWPAAGIVTLLAGLAAYSAAWQKSATFDEPAHLTAGASYWLTGDFRLHPENGNLPQRLAGLPALLEGWRLPPLDRPAWQRSEVYVFANDLLHHQGNDPDRMLRHARGAMVPLAVALWLAIYAAARRLAGPRAGMAALLLAACDPNLLAHAPLATSDMAATLFFLLAAEGFWRAIERPGPGSVAGSCLAWAALFLSKMSAGLIVPVAGLLVALRLLRGEPLEVRLAGRRFELRRRAAQALACAAIAAVHFAVVVALLWAAFGFRYEAFHAHRTPLDRFEGGVPNLLGERSPLGRAVGWAERARLLPEAYLYGFSFALDQAEARPTFMAGEIRPAGRRGFFPYAFAVKTPESLLVLLAAALARGIVAARRAGVGRVPGKGGGLLPGLAPYGALALVYGAAALGSGLNIGHRHLLPLYPPLLVLAGAVAAAGAAAGGWRRAAAVACLAYGAGTALLVWPSYLSYFNPTSGGPRAGYRKLVDSSLDWGQDLPALRRWQDRNGAGEGVPFYLSYFGTASPDHHGIRARRLPGFFDLDRPPVLHPLEPGLYAISASMLQVYGAPVAGPWDPAQEAAYQQLRLHLEGSAPAAPALPYRDGPAERFDRLRLGRLCAFLRRRPPDDEVGGSILVFRLDAAEVEAALRGPAPYGS